MHPSPLNGVGDSLRRKATDGWKMLSQKVKASKRRQSFCLGEGIWPQPKKKKGKKKGTALFMPPIGTAALNGVRLEQTEEEHESIIGHNQQK